MSSGMATESPNYTANTNSLRFENNSSTTNNNTRADTNEAYVLLSLHSAPTSPSGHHRSITWSKENTSPYNINDDIDQSIVARLETRGSEYLIRKAHTIIGRNSSRGMVDVSIGHSNFISRRHLEIYFQPPNKFYLICIGKNGVFINEIFQSRGLPAFPLPQTCVFRFPSTNILLEFQSLIPSSNNQEDLEMETKSSLIYRPLKVNIPEIVTTASNSEFVSPAPSPTGTISAANSCPASPRSSNTVRFRFGNHHHANNGQQEEFQTMVAYAAAAMSKENNNTLKNEPLLSTNNANIINNQNNNMINDNNKNNSIAANVTGINNVVFAKNDGNVVGDNKNIQGTSKVFQLSPSFQYAQAQPIIASVSNNSSQGIIINNGANFIKTQNGQLIHSIATPTQITTTKNTNNNTNHQQNDSNISKSLNTSSQSPEQYSSAGADDDGKPPYSYAQLIVQAIASAHDKQLTLSGIYSFITKNYPYYRTAEKGWQNSIRHNLSLNRYFLKVSRSQSEPGKGSFWRIDPASESKLIEQSMKRRRQRPNTGCLLGENPNRNSSRSAPTSPSNSGFVSGLVTPDSLSRESSPSPIQDNIESEIICNEFLPAYLTTIPDKHYNCKSSPGSPGSSGASQHSQSNSAVITTIPIPTNLEIPNNGKPQATQIAYTSNGNKMILERHAVSPLQLVVNHQQQPNNGNAAATATAAIALTDLQNSFEIPKGSRQPISTNNSTIIQPTVIVQAPSTTATATPPVAGNNQNDNLNLQKVVICQPSTAAESSPFTKSISKPEITITSSPVVESSNLISPTTTETTAVVTTVNTTNTSRPIDLLTSVALADAANVNSNNDNDSQSKPATSSSPTKTTFITTDSKPNNAENSVAINLSSINTRSDDDDNKLENKTETLKRNLEQSNDNDLETNETTSKKLKTDDNE